MWGSVSTPWNSVVQGSEVGVPPPTSWHSRGPGRPWRALALILTLKGRL